MRGSHTDAINPQVMLLPLVLAAIPVVPIQFPAGSECGVFVGRGPVDLTLQLDGAQTFEIDPKPAPNRPPLEVMLLVPKEEAYAVIEPARYQRLRTPRGGRYVYRVMSAAPVDVRFCAF